MVGRATSTVSSSKAMSRVFIESSWFRDVQMYPVRPGGRRKVPGGDSARVNGSTPRLTGGGGGGSGAAPPEVDASHRDGHAYRIGESLRLGPQRPGPAA